MTVSRANRHMAGVPREQAEFSYVERAESVRLLDAARYDSGMAQGQIERFCRSCRHSLRGIASRKCPECGRAFDPSDPRTTSSRPYHSVWDYLAGLAIILAFAAALLAMASFVMSAMLAPGIANDWFWFWGPGLLAACAILLAPALVVLLALTMMPQVRLKRRYRIVGVVSTVLFVSIAWTHWPLRVSMRLPQSALNRVADRALASGDITTPGWVGHLHYRRVRVIHNGNVGFQLTGGSGGGTYLVRCVPDADRVWYNMNWKINLGGNWHLAYED